MVCFVVEDSVGFERMICPKEHLRRFSNRLLTVFGPDGKPVTLAAKSADVLRRQADGTWRFVIDNPWGTD